MVFVYLFISLFFLLISGGVLISALSRMSSHFKVSFFLISFLMMAGATTIPELFVSIQAAFNNETALAFGTVVGSNIANIALALGLLLILSPRIKISGSIMRLDSIIMAAIAVAPFLLIIDGILSRIDGLVLLFLFFFYLFSLLQSTRFFKKIKYARKSKGLFKDIFIFIASVIILLLSSHYVVVYTEKVALFLKLPMVLMGLVLIAIGTSLPEMVIAYRASKAKKPELSLGDITGAVVFNASLILGIAAVISPFSISSFFQYLISGIFTLFLFIYFVIGVFNDKVFRRPFGFILIASYIIFLVLEFL